MIPEEKKEGKMSRIRTINECLKLIKEHDPGTSITYNALRSLVEDLGIKHLKAGNRFLVNYDDLLEKLYG